MRHYRITNRKTVYRKLHRLMQATALVAVAALSVRFAAEQTYTVSATQETKQALEDAKDARKESQSQLDEKQDNIGDLNDTKSGLESELSSLNSQLTDVSADLAETESNISDKEAEIETTKQNLQQAEDTAQAQYEAMKKRVQFIYESQSFVLVEILLKADSFADFLNNSEYVSELSDYDRRQLLSYEQTVASIEDQKTQLESEQADLEAYKAQQQEEQNRVSGLVSSTSSAVSSYSSQIDSAEAEAEALEAKIAQQDQNIASLQAKLAEEIRMSQLAANSSWRDISEVTFADGDRMLLANLIYCEAGGEPYAGQVAVGAVVINRVLSSVYPDTVVGVIYQNRQFSPVASGRLALALASDKATASCYKAADEAMSGATNVGECVYFRTPIPGLTGTQIGGHIFY